MTIEPAIVRLPTIYQDSAYRVQLRLTDRLRKAKIGNTGLIQCDCHGLGVGAKVVLLSKLPTANLCGVVLNQIYYISPLDFGPASFRMTTSLSGGNILNIESAGDQEFYIAQPVNITGYTIDADICKKQTNIRIQVSSFTATIDAAVDGAFSLRIAPSVSVAVAAGEYAYDVSMTPPSGERFFAIAGEVPVAVTRSRT
jgi:hypothetical protein